MFKTKKKSKENIEEKKAAKTSRARATKSKKKNSAGNVPALVNKLTPTVVNSFRECNHKILLLVLAITFFGVFMVFSAGYYQTVNLADPDPFMFLKKQGVWAVLGLILLTFSTCVDYHQYNRFGNVIILMSLLLLVAVLLVGRTVNGAQRWIFIFGVQVTPSELSKLAVIVFTSVYLAANPKRIHGKYMATLMMIMALHFALIVKQPNLSTAIVVCAIMMGIMFIAGLDMRIIYAMFGLGVGGMVFILNFMKNTHWYDRLTSWMDPFADAQGTGYQVSQGLIALGNGGLTGLGPGNSIAKNLYLPEPQNDFILAIIGEELGFIGIVVLMLAYIVLFTMCIMTAAKAKDRLGFYLAAGVAIMLGLQVVINVAVVTASMPATGITLPFVSYGGTSLLVFMYSLGIVLNISKGQSNKSRQKVEQQK